MKKIILLGAGEFSKEVLNWIEDAGHVIHGFFDEEKDSEKWCGLPVYKSFSRLQGYKFLPAVGNPKDKVRLVGMALSAGLLPCNTIVHPKAIVGKNNKIERGSIICPGAIITTGCYIGEFCTINISATIGHGCYISKFTTISPSANISGGCHIGEKSYIGTNASIREGLSFGNQTVIGMGAVVLKGCKEDGTVLVGNPASPLKK